MSYAPNLTVFTDANPVPRVLVKFTTLDPACASVNVERTQEGRTYPVRAATGKSVAGGLSVLDTEAGFGVSLSYRAQMFDSGGISLGYTSAATTQLNISKTWIHQPLNPQLAIKGRIFNTTAQSLQRVTPGQFVIPEGATVGAWIGSQFQGLQNVPLRLKVSSPDDGDTFLSMFGSYTSDYPAVICIRTPPPARLPRTLFFSPGGNGGGVEENAQANFTLLIYTFTGNESAPPSPALVVPLLRRADLDAAYATRGAMDATYATRLDMDTDYSKAGLAG